MDDIFKEICKIFDEATPSLGQLGKDMDAVARDLKKRSKKLGGDLDEMEQQMRDLGFTP